MPKFHSDVTSNGISEWRYQAGTSNCLVDFCSTWSASPRLRNIQKDQMRIDVGQETLGDLSYNWLYNIRMIFFPKTSVSCRTMSISIILFILFKLWPKSVVCQFSKVIRLGWVAVRSNASYLPWKAASNNRVGHRNEQNIPHKKTMLSNQYIKDKVAL